MSFGTGYFGQQYFGGVALPQGVDYTLSLSDTITLNDSVQKYATLTLEDITHLTDDISKLFNLNTEDTILVNDVLGTSETFVLSLGDAIILSDNISKVIGLNESDTITLTDFVTKALDLTKEDDIDLDDLISVSPVVKPPITPQPSYDTGGGAYIPILKRGRAELSANQIAQRLREKRIEEEDEAILAIIKTFVRCH